MATDKLHQFIESIINIEAPAQNLFGKGIPGMLGTSGPANQASETSSSQVIHQLKHDALELVRLHTKHLDDKTIRHQCQKIEGSLLMATTLGIITETEANQLQDELQDIKPREKPLGE